MIPLAAGYQHFADGAPFAEIALRHPSVKEVYFPWVGEPSGRPMLGFEEEDDPEEDAPEGVAEAAAPALVDGFGVGHGE